MTMTAQAYWDMKSAAHAVLIGSYGAKVHECREFLASAEKNAFMLAAEEPDGIDPYKTGDFSNVAERLYNSMEGRIEECFDIDDCRELKAAFSAFINLDSKTEAVETITIENLFGEDIDVTKEEFVKRWTDQTRDMWKIAAETDDFLIVDQIDALVADLAERSFDSVLAQNKAHEEKYS